MTSDLGHAIRQGLSEEAPASGPLLEWASLKAKARRRAIRRRSAAVVTAGALAGAAFLAAPSLAGHRTNSSVLTPAVESARGAVQMGTGQDGCPAGLALVQAADATGSTTLTRTAAEDWICSSGVSPTDGALSFISYPWSDAGTDSKVGTWVGPLSLDTCDGHPCGTVVWSAVSLLPPGVSTVEIQVVGDPTTHDAIVSDQAWAIRLHRPVEDNTLLRSSAAMSGQTLHVRVEFGHDDSADTRFTAVDAAFRASCESALASTPFPEWNDLECTDALLQHNLNTSSADFAASVQYDAQCQWFAEFLVAIDVGEAERAQSALSVISGIPTWSGFSDNGLGDAVEVLYEQARGGDASGIRQLFPSSPGGAASCSYTYLQEARAWAPENK